MIGNLVLIIAWTGFFMIFIPLFLLAIGLGYILKTPVSRETESEDTS